MKCWHCERKLFRWTKQHNNQAQFFIKTSFCNFSNYFDQILNLNVRRLLDKELFSSIGFDCWDDRRILSPDVELLLWSSSYCKWSNNNFRELRCEPQLGRTKGLNPVEGKNLGWDESLSDLWKQNYNSNTLNIFRFEWF